MAFLGDSYTAGTGAVPLTDRWTTLVAAHLGRHEINFGVGGTGYARNSTFGLPYQQRVTAVTIGKPDMVIVSGGRNDLGLPSASEVAAVKSTFAQLRNALPTVQIIAISPFWDSSSAPAGLKVIAGYVSDAVHAVGGTYLDIGQPLAGKPGVIAADKVHPVAGGYALIAAAVEAKYAAASLPVS